VGFGQSIGDLFGSITEGIGNLAPAITAAAPFFAPQPAAPQRNIFDVIARDTPGGGIGGGIQTVGLPALALGGLALGLGESIGSGVLGMGGTSSSPVSGTLFRQTPSGRIRAVNKATIMGPDGKVHFFLHAVPKGFKVNVANVSGRTRHHHHPR